MTVDAASRTRRHAPRAAAAGTAEPSGAPLAMSPPSLAPRIYPTARPAYASRPMIATAPAYAIGEIDQTVFDCPVCSRPLALGVRRCPGCRTRLISSVPLTKASLFVAAGLAIGLLLGAGGGLLFGLANAPVPAAIAAGPSGGPSSSAGAGLSGATSSAPASSSPVVTPLPTPPSTIPPATRAALIQLAGANGRLGMATGDLRAALAVKAFDPSAVAQILRSVSADTVYAEQLARGVTWAPAGPLGASLATAYNGIHDSAAEALDSSVQNTEAYRAAAMRMVELIDGLAELDAAIRSTAASAGLDLPAASGAPAAP